MKLAGSQRALFASDMHLGEHDSATAAFFHQALGRCIQHPETRPTHLFLLGDLFEVWVGDDDPGEAGRALSRQLQDWRSDGISVFVMRGNRDFLLGIPLATTPDWPGRAGATLLPDPFLLDLFGVPTVLCHGDSLCTEDLAYQSFRATVRDPAWQAAFLARPLAERLAIARSIRMQSEQGKSEKGRTEEDLALMDASETAIRALFSSSQALCMIHGHTHRPGRHTLEASGTPEKSASPLIRHVLPDWKAPEPHAPSRGYFLLADQSGIRVIQPSS